MLEFIYSNDTRNRKRFYAAGAHARTRATSNRLRFRAIFGQSRTTNCNIAEVLANRHVVAVDYFVVWFVAYDLSDLVSLQALYHFDLLGGVIRK